MKPLFKSPELQERFERDGFARLQLLDADEAEDLLTMYNTVANEHEAVNIPYITTSHTNNHELIAKVDKMVQSVLVPRLDVHLQNYKLLFGNFLVKMPIEGSDTPPHQDITFVDEQEHFSVNIWVALQDNDQRNGCMYFLPGSHKFMHTIRPTHYYPWAYEKVKPSIIKNSMVFPSKAGEAFVFMHSVVHGSYANISGVPRVAAVIAAYTDGADLVHYYLPNGDPNKELEKYSMTKEAYIHFVKEQPPAKGVFLENVRHDFKQVDEKELKSMLNKDRPLLKRILSKLVG